MATRSWLQKHRSGFRVPICASGHPAKGRSTTQRHSRTLNLGFGVDPANDLNDKVEERAFIPKLAALKHPLRLHFPSNESTEYDVDLRSDPFDAVPFCVTA